jgi:2OG-Fe(II) oxygenase superfamily
LIEPELFQTIMQRVDSAKFQRYEFDGVISQTVMDDPATCHVLLFLANMPSLHRLVERITGCRRIANFRGRVYQLMPVSDDHIEWHSDMLDHRMIAFSLNLTRKIYRGGSLQIRYANSEELLHEVQNTGLGDALLMRVAKKMRHRVLPVEGDVPRTAMAGWFRWGKGDYYGDLRKTVESGSTDSNNSDSDH